MGFVLDQCRHCLCLVVIPAHTSKVLYLKPFEVPWMPEGDLLGRLAVFPSPPSSPTHTSDLWHACCLVLPLVYAMASKLIPAFDATVTACLPNANANPE